MVMVGEIRTLDFRFSMATCDVPVVGSQCLNTPWAGSKGVAALFGCREAAVRVDGAVREDMATAQPAVFVGQWALFRLKLAVW